MWSEVQIPSGLGPCEVTLAGPGGELSVQQMDFSGFLIQEETGDVRLYLRGEGERYAEIVMPQSVVQTLGGEEPAMASGRRSE